MRRLSLGLVVGALLTVASSAWADGWQLVRTEAGVVVSKKEVPGSPYMAFRGEGDVAAPLLQVADVLVDVPHEKDWIDSVKEARILRKVSDTEYIMYSHLGAPPTISDRDFVTDVSLTAASTGGDLVVTMRSVDDPSGPSTGYVRAQLIDSSFALHANPDGTTHVVAEIHADPKGLLPSWIVNWFQRSWGYNTITSLRRQVARGVAPANPLLRERLRS